MQWCPPVEPNRGVDRGPTGFFGFWIEFEQRWPWGKFTRHSPHVAHLVVSEPRAGTHSPCTRRGEPPLPALVYERGGCLALASEANNNRASPHLTSPCLVCLAIYNVQIYCLGWNACISYVTSNGAASPTAAASLTAAVSPLAAALTNGVTKRRRVMKARRVTKRRHVTNGCRIPMGHRVTKLRRETALSLNGATSPTGHLDAALPIGQYYA